MTSYKKSAMKSSNINGATSFMINNVIHGDHIAAANCMMTLHNMMINNAKYWRSRRKT